MANIEMNYYDGSNYTILYPKIDLNNNNGTVLSSSYGGTGFTSINNLVDNIRSNFGNIYFRKSTYSGNGNTTYTLTWFYNTLAIFVTPAFTMNTYGMAVPLLFLKNTSSSSYSNPRGQLISIMENGSTYKYNYITYNCSNNIITITDTSKFYNISSYNYDVLYLIQT